MSESELPEGITGEALTESYDEGRIARYYQRPRGGYIRMPRSVTPVSIDPYVRTSVFTRSMDRAFNHNIRNQRTIIRLGSNVKRLNDSLQNMGTMNMFSSVMGLFLNSPKIDMIKFPATQAINPGQELSVENSRMKPMDMTFLLLTLMLPIMTQSQGGSPSGSGGGMNFFMMFMMILLLTGGLGGLGGTGTRP